MVMESLERLDPPRVLGKWSLLAKLGEGGMATVYVASVGAGPLQRLAAVKLLRANAPDHDYRTRFMDEAAVVVRLHHNNIVDVREAGEVTGQLFIAMELIEGRDLADIWDLCAEAGRAFPVALAVYIVREVLRGLHYAHTFPGLSLVHRDISPSNVLIDWAGAVRLADFGLATSTLKAADTVPGMVFGKVGYMAPEQARRGPLDGRADVYGCGVVLWELLTGRPLRESGTSTQAVAAWEASPPSTKSSRIDADLDAIVVKALSRDREQRHQSAAELLGELSGWLAAHAPTTTQEVVSDFMRGLFTDARERDHQAHESLLLQARERAAAVPAEEDSTLDQNPGDAVPRDRTGIGARVSDGEAIPPGTIVAERYRIEAPIGVGGMGTVYLAEHVTVGRKVAVKVLTHEWSHNEVVARRFREEARAASAAGHPNIVEVFDAGELTDRRLYLVMENLNGHTLFEEIRQQAPFTVVRACRVIRDVARAIRAAHSQGIIHRDLKPDNIMLVRRGEEERVKVLDFGISASATRAAEEARLTLPGHALGTPEYMAPEQGRGRPSTPQFDIYAIGVILYEMLAGEPPFVSTNIVEVLARKATEPPPPLSGHRNDLPPALMALCHACLALDPAARPPTADAFIRELDPLMTAMLGPGIEGTELLASTLSGPTTGHGGAPLLRPGHGPAELSAELVAATNPDATEMLPPPPSLPGFEAALAGVGSRPHEASSLITTPVDLESGGAQQRGSRLPLIIGGALGLISVAVLAWVALRGDPAADDAGPPPGTADSGVALAQVAPPDGVVASPQAPAASDDAADEPDEGVAPTFPPPEGPPDQLANGSSAGQAAPSDGGSTGAKDAGDDSEAPPDAPAVVPDAASPDPSPASNTARPKDASKTPACERTRRDASSAHAARKWDRAITLLGKRDCWTGSGRSSRRRMLVKAYFETKQFAKCLRAGRGAKDSATKGLTATCKARVELDHG